MIGVGGPSFDEEDDLLTSNDDEDLQKDPISLIDLRVRSFFSNVCWTRVTDIDKYMIDAHHVVLKGMRGARCGGVWSARGATGC